MARASTHVPSDSAQLSFGCRISAPEQVGAEPHNLILGARRDLRPESWSASLPLLAGSGPHDSVL